MEVTETVTTTSDGVATFQPVITTEEATEALRTTPFEEDVTSEAGFTTEEVTEAVTTISDEDAISESVATTEESTEAVKTTSFEEEITSQYGPTTEEATETVTSTPKEVATSQQGTTAEQVTELRRSTPFEEEVTSPPVASTEEVTETVRTTPFGEEVTSEPSPTTEEVTVAVTTTPELEANSQSGTTAQDFTEAVRTTPFEDNITSEAGSTTEEVTEAVTTTPEGEATSQTVVMTEEVTEALRTTPFGEQLTSEPSPTTEEVTEAVTMTPEEEVTSPPVATTEEVTGAVRTTPFEEDVTSQPSSNTEEVTGAVGSTTREQVTSEPSPTTEEVTEAVTTTPKEEPTSLPATTIEEVTELRRTTPFGEEVTSQPVATTEEFTEAVRTTPFREEVTSESSPTTEEVTEAVTTTPEEEETSQSGTTAEEFTEIVRTTPFEEDITSDAGSTTEEVTDAITTTPEEESTTRSVVTTENITEAVKTTPEEVPSQPGSSTEEVTEAVTTTPYEEVITSEAGSTNEEVTEAVTTTPELELTSQSGRTTEAVTEPVRTTPFEEDVTSQPGASTEEVTEALRTTLSEEEATSKLESTTLEVSEAVRTTPFEEGTTQPGTTTEEVTEALRTTPYEEVTTQPVATTEEVTEAVRTTPFEKVTLQPHSSTEEVTTYFEGETSSLAGITTGLTDTPGMEAGTMQYQSTTNKLIAETTSTFESELTSNPTDITTEFIETATLTTPQEVASTSSEITTVFVETTGVKGTTSPDQFTSEEGTEAASTTKFVVEVTLNPTDITTEAESATFRRTIVTEVLATTEAFASTVEPESTTQRESSTTVGTFTTRKTNPATERPSTEVPVITTVNVATTQEPEGTTQGEGATTKEMVTTRQTNPATKRPTTEGSLVTIRNVVSTLEPEGTTQSEIASTVETVTTRQTNPATERHSTEVPLVTTKNFASTLEPEGTTQGESATTKETITNIKTNSATERPSTKVPVVSTRNIGSTVEPEGTTQDESGTTKESVATTQTNPATEQPESSTQAPGVATTNVASSVEPTGTTQGESVTNQETVTTKQTNPVSERQTSTEVPVVTTSNVASTVKPEGTTQGESATTRETVTTGQTNPATERPSTEVPLVTTRNVASTVEPEGTTQDESATTRETIPATERPEGSTQAPGVVTSNLVSTVEPKGTTQGESATTKETVTTRRTNPATERPSTEVPVVTTRNVISTLEPEGTTQGKSATTAETVTTRHPASERPSSEVPVVTTRNIPSTAMPQMTTQSESATTRETLSTRKTNPATNQPEGSTQSSGVSTANVASTVESQRTTQGESATTREIVSTRQTNPATKQPEGSTQAPGVATTNVGSTVELKGTTQGESATTKETVTTRQTNPGTERPVVSTVVSVASTEAVVSTLKPEVTTQSERTTSKTVVTTRQTNPATERPEHSTEAPAATTKDQQVTSRSSDAATTGAAVTPSSSSFTSSESLNTTNITTQAPMFYTERVRATATILELNGAEAFVSPPLQDPTSPLFLNFQASLCNTFLEYFQDLSINTTGIECSVTNLVSGSIIASMEFNVTGSNQDEALVIAEGIFNSQFMTEMFLIDSVSRNVFVFGSFLVDGADVCGLEAPCLNGGSCRGSGYNSFLCTCAEGWTGDTCEQEFLIVLEVIGTGDSVVELAWNYPERDDLVAFVFEYRKTDEDSWVLSTLISSDAREYTLTGLDPDTLYFVRLLGFFTTETRVISFQKAFLTTEAVIPPDTGAAQSPQTLSSSVFIWILVVVALIAFVLFIFVAVMVYRRRRDGVTLPFRDFRGRFAVGVRDNVAYDFEIQGGPPSPPSVSAMALGPDRPRPDYWEIPRERLVVGNRKQIGRFGEVYFGKVHIGSQSLALDIKKQRGNTPLDKKKILAELSILSRVGRHANVLNLVGACSKSSGPVYLAFESMEPVRLDVYLRTVQDVHKPVTMHVPDFNITTPLMPMLLKFSVDIASGLSHLASKRIVQHSLGVRNIALSVDLVAKVTDFAIKDESPSNGRTLNVGLGDSQSSFPSSARWMAYETLVFNTCTEQSNVWSLGVILWEIMSFGHEPFSGYHVDELSRKLTEGYTLNQPDGCLDDIYEIIQSCLKLEPNDRPTIKSLVARLARRYQCIKLQDKETRAEVFQSLAQLSDNHDNMSPPQIRSMEMLVNGNIEKELPQARLMAVQYAATAFPGNHIASKYTLLTACGDEIEVVRTEAINIIKMQARIAEMDMESDTPSGKMLPAFPQMINHIRLKAFDNLPNSSQKSQGPLGVFTIPFKALVYEKVAVYLRMCLAYSAGASPNAFKTAEMMNQGPILSRYVNDLMEMYAGDTGAPISTYTGLLRQYVSAIGGGRGMYSLLEIVAMAPDKLALQFVKKTDNLKMLLHSDEEAVRLYTAQLLGVVLCYAPPPLVVDTITSFTSRMDSGSTESCQAMIWALGFVIGRQMQKELLANKDTFSRLTDTHNLGENIYRRATEAIVTKLDSSSPTIVKAACTAIAEIGRNGPIPLPKGGKTNGRSKGSSDSVRSKSSYGSNGSKNGVNGPTKLSLVQRLSEIFIRDSVLFLLEVKKEAALALAHLMVGEAEFPYSKLVLEALPKGLKTSAPSREQLYPFQFHLADALSTALQGPSAPAAADPWLEENTTPLGRATPTNGDLKTLLETLLSDRQKTNNSDEKEAISVMLTVLLETFRHSQSVQHHEAEMKNIIKDAVMEWDANGVISDLPRNLQKRILEVLKLTRVSSDAPSAPPMNRMDSPDEEPTYAVVRRVTPDIHSSSGESSNTTNEASAMLDVDMANDVDMVNDVEVTNDDDEMTAF